MSLSPDQATQPEFAVRGSVRRKGWTRVTHGVHRLCAAGRPGLAEELRAWQLALPLDLVFTHLTAAELRGWWLPARIPAQPFFAAIPVEMPRPRRTGLLVARHADVPVGGDIGGVRIATSADIILECARDLEALDLVVLVDSALRSGDVMFEALQAAAASGRRGAPRLRKALELADPRSESAWESVARVLHVAAGIPVEVQYVVRDDEGVFVARGDLRIAGTRRLHEYDGAVHRTSTQHVEDLDRDRRLQLVSWQRFGYTSRRLIHQGAVVIRDADLALGRTWDPRRLQRWNAMIRPSSYSPSGRRRLAERWARAWGPPRRRTRVA